MKKHEFFSAKEFSWSDHLEEIIFPSSHRITQGEHLQFHSFLHFFSCESKIF